MSAVPDRIAPEGRGVGGSERLYAGLMRAYPEAFRSRYAAEMVQLFADQLREARHRGPVSGVVWTWLRSLIDLAANAAGEHARKDRTMAQSLETFRPTAGMRVLGLVGLVGGVVLLWAWLAWNPFADRTVNTVRLLLFWAGGSSVAVAFHPRQAARSPRLAFVATAAVLVASAWNVLWLLLAVDRTSPFADAFGLAGFVASLAGWLAAAFYGLAVLVIRAIRGIDALVAASCRFAGITLFVGGLMAPLGMDRLGFTRSESYGELSGTLGAVGVSLTAVGWLVLSLILVLGGRGRSDHGEQGSQ